jgi:hypothetical protein
MLPRRRRAPPLHPVAHAGWQPGHGVGGTWQGIRVRGQGQGGNSLAWGRGYHVNVNELRLGFSNMAWDSGPWDMGAFGPGARGEMQGACPTSGGGLPSAKCRTRDQRAVSKLDVAKHCLGATGSLWGPTTSESCVDRALPSRSQESPTESPSPSNCCLFLTRTQLSSLMRVGADKVPGGWGIRGRVWVAEGVYVCVGSGR